MLYNMESFNGNVSLPNIIQVLILCHYMLLVLVPAEMEVRVRFIEYCSLYTNIQGHNQGDGLVSMLSPFDNYIRAILTFESSVVHIEFQGSRQHRIAAHLLPGKHECIYFAPLPLHAPAPLWFSVNSTSLLQCGRTPA